MTLNILKPLLTARSLRRRVFFLFVVASLLSVGGENTNAFAQAKKQTRGMAIENNARAIETLFGPSIMAVRGFQPFHLTGDFNGDGAPDIVMVVRIVGPQSKLPQDVQVVTNAFGYGTAGFPFNPAVEPPGALAIVHGTAAGWNTPNAGKFLLVGESPILILSYNRGVSTHPPDHMNLMHVMRKPARRRRGASWPPAAAKGDAVILETEATDSILYWNGKTYRWEEAAGGE
jgi:hypothetical protein